MMKKQHSKSFASKKQASPNNLPPLMLKNQKQDTIKIEPSIVNCFNRPSFIIRKKNYSISESQTTRRISELRQKIAYRKQIIISQHEQNIKYQDQNVIDREVLKNKDYNKMINTPDYQLQLKDQDIEYKTKIDKKSDVTDNSILNNMPTPKSTKKNSKKRKIEQCKIIKIPWGQKNNIFDVSISEIKQKLNYNQETPLQSLQQLYVQML